MRSGVPPYHFELRNNNARGGGGDGCDAATSLVLLLNPPLLIIISSLVVGTAVVKNPTEKWCQNYYSESSKMKSLPSSFRHLEEEETGGRG